MVPFGVRTMGDHIWEKYAPTHHPQKGREYTQITSQNGKIWKLQYLQNCKSDQGQISGSSWDRQLHFVGGLKLPRSNPIWLLAAILKKWIWRHNSAADLPITTKFDRHTQNAMPMTIHRSVSKLEIKFQYGGDSMAAILKIRYDVITLPPSSAGRCKMT